MKAHKSNPSHRILIVDDNTAIHKDFCKILMKPSTNKDLSDMEALLFGSKSQTITSDTFEIDCATQGREALSLLKKAQSEGRPYSLAFVDGRMPPGWDGVETISHLWKESPDLQVVLCSAYADYSWQDIRRVLGESDNLLILKKPFDNVEVLQMAHALTRKWELSHEVRGRIKNLDHIVRERTEEKEHMGALLEAALEHSPAGIIISDTKSGKIRWANAAASQIIDKGHLFCRKSQNMTSEHDTDWKAFQPDGNQYGADELPLFRATDKNEVIQNEVFIIRNALGHEKWISSNAAPVRNSDKMISAGILVFQDITQLKQVEKEKLIAQEIAAANEKYALVGQIAGKIAHDFNNILAAILGNTELALLQCTHSSIMKKLKLILNQSVRGKNLTRNLVAFAKAQKPKQKYFKINDKIELVLNLLQKELENIDVIRDYGSHLPDLMADPGMIEHALLNIVQNSIHAMSLSDHPEISIRTHQLDKTIAIEIEDNGCGIPEEFFEKIFEPSFTLKGREDHTGSYKPSIKGTGYGMANVKKYIDQHKGMISIFSIMGKGTKITITLPVIKRLLTDKEVEAVHQEELCSGNYILLVEDEQAISDVQYQILTNAPCNHKVDIAANGQIAMDLLDRSSYDFISLDYLLPGDINGLDVYHYIRKSNRTVPILFVSGNLEFIESIKRLQQKDIHVDHLAKPCQNIDYVNSINALMNTRNH